MWLHSPSSHWSWQQARGCVGWTIPSLLLCCCCALQPLSLPVPGRRAFIGVGFADRGDAFDFNVALQDHFKWVRQQSELARQDLDQGPKLDLGFKEGQTIKLNIANMKKKEGATGNTRPRPAGPGGLTLLPPPPGGKSCGERPPSLPGPARLPGTPITDSVLSWPQPSAPAAPAADAWGDFAKASGSTPNQTQGNWVQF
ncbi:adaptin ear-binding coat-associated protein 2 [Manacus vitellinus]|uniref:adaptin ear-binding coat-associated protein 2 n=1 Tax=Manacus vitellinus TaxID=328815 RepID=UPI00115F580C|nr:adaptin ear-binding coat-associated protein 2 [Manacus vitellinus]